MWPVALILDNKSLDKSPEGDSEICERHPVLLPPLGGQERLLEKT